MFDERVVAVPSPLAAVLPRGGLVGGAVVTISAADTGGATSALLALLSAAHAGDKQMWAAAVGLPDLGIVAAAELGVDLTRLVLVPQPGADIAPVLSVLIDGFAVVAVALPAGLSAGGRRVLQARLRQAGAVLLVAGVWPGADVGLTVVQHQWSGLGAGYGRLRDRQLLLQVAGRRVGAHRGKLVRLDLHATDENVIVSGQQASPAAERHGRYGTYGNYGSYVG